MTQALRVPSVITFDSSVGVGIPFAQPANSVTANSAIVFFIIISLFVVWVTSLSLSK